MRSKAKPSEGADAGYDFAHGDAESTPAAGQAPMLPYTPCYDFARVEAGFEAGLDAPTQALLWFCAYRGRVEAGLEAGLDAPIHALLWSCAYRGRVEAGLERQASMLPHLPCYCFDRNEAEADPKLYIIIKGVGLGLGRRPERKRRRILVRHRPQVGKHRCQMGLRCRV